MGGGWKVPGSPSSPPVLLKNSQGPSLSQKFSKAQVSANGRLGIFKVSFFLQVGASSSVQSYRVLGWSGAGIPLWYRGMDFGSGAVRGIVPVAGRIEDGGFWGSVTGS